MPNTLKLAVFLVLSTVLFGCAESTQPVAPTIAGITSNSPLAFFDGRYLWGLYEIHADAKHENFEIVPTRQTTGHWNVLKWLEQSPCTSCLKIVKIVDPGNGTRLVDIQIKHPFSNPNLTGFDVRGIPMFTGSHSFPVSGLNMPDRTLGDGELVNADGYTSLYNVTTEGGGPGGLQGYIKGKLSTKTPPNALLNGYKRFVSSGSANTRNAFYAGDAVTVTYEIAMPSGAFVFGYAVDACWEPPIKKPVTDPMKDFSISANCEEAWKIAVTDQPIGDGLTDTGGQAKLTIDVYDWQGKDEAHKVLLECLELFDGEVQAGWKEDSAKYTRYEAVVENTKLAAAGKYRVLVRKEAQENDPAGKPWLDLTAYQVHMVTVKSFSTGNGNLMWAKRAGGTSIESYGGVARLSDNSTVVTGSFRGTATFGPGEPNQTVMDSTGDYDLFIAKYNPDGKLAWAKSAGGGSAYDDVSGNGVTVLSDNSIFVTGGFMGSIIFGKGESNQTILTSTAGVADIFIAKYNANGTLTWVKRVGGSFDDKGDGVTALSDNSIVVMGTFETTVIFGEGEPNQTVLTSTTIYDPDFFIARYNANGMLAWAKSAGGSPYVSDNGIVALSDNSTVVTGNFTNTMTFGKDEPNQTILTSVANNDIFVARYNSDGSLGWAKRAGGLSEDEGSGITRLSDDSTVVTGNFSGQITFGEGEPNQTIFTGYRDIFLARYNPDGTLAWAKRAGGNDADAGFGIAALSDDSTVVTGYFFVSAKFGEGEPNQTELISAGYEDIFISRYYSDGTLDWVKHAGGPNGDYGEKITALSDDSTVVGGRFGGIDGGPATFGEGEPNQTILTSVGGTDIFVARYNP